MRVLLALVVLCFCSVASAQVLIRVGPSPNMNDRLHNPFPNNVGPYPYHRTYPYHGYSNPYHNSWKPYPYHGVYPLPYEMRYNPRYGWYYYHPRYGWVYHNGPKHPRM